VLLVDAAAPHVAAINADGLTIESPGVADWTVRVRAVTPEALTGPRDLVLLAVAAEVRLEAFDEYDPALYRRALAGDEGARAAAMAAVSHHYRTRTKTKTGVWRDLAVRKRTTEASVFDVTLDQGDKHALPLPLTRRMLALIHDIEDGRRAMAWDNLDDLVAIHRGLA
jgi:2-dehydropantoate 2-reductase